MDRPSSTRKKDLLASPFNVYIMNSLRRKWRQTIVVSEMTWKYFRIYATVLNDYKLLASNFVEREDACNFFEMKLLKYWWTPKSLTNAKATEMSLN